MQSPSIPSFANDPNLSLAASAMLPRRMPSLPERNSAIPVIAPDYSQAPLSTMQSAKPNTRIVRLVLDTNNRNAAAYPDARKCTLKLAEPLRNVYALRILRSQLTTISSTNAYVRLNGYQNLMVVDNTNGLSMDTNAYASYFALVLPGNELHPATTQDISSDPNAVMLKPSVDKLTNFELEVRDNDSNLYTDAAMSLTLTLAAYCYDTI